ncbi:MAG: hypothetical protein QGG36_14415 [Pirellulaceae bacterium]|nr:hypothetical protein [Pirellulaceae bacterium]
MRRAIGLGVICIGLAILAASYVAAQAQRDFRRDSLPVNLLDPYEAEYVRRAVRRAKPNPMARPDGAECGAPNPAASSHPTAAVVHRDGW